ncbi:hypothetical protein [Flavobacterium panici]|uniref:hypothetical protein n=1 Tax=Flavobacterium panici TaxID=2654843 RepID=UPI003743428E
MAKYKVNLIEHRIRFSDKRMNEIAYEFGFTDVSHLNKFFQKTKRIQFKRCKETLNKK